MNIRAVFFDIDGVLLNSLEPHLKICEDISMKNGLPIKIPDPVTFKNSIVRKGVKISPMEFFFKAVGFSDIDAKMADQYYKSNFKNKYKIEPFPKIYNMLKELKKINIQLGIITS